MSLPLYLEDLYYVLPTCRIHAAACIAYLERLVIYSPHPAHVGQNLTAQVSESRYIQIKYT